MTSWTGSSSLWIATTSLAVALACALFVAGDELAGRRQKMAVMNIVWPITMLWSGPLGLWAYLRFGRAGRQGSGKFPTIAKATLHCGSGCTIGDLVAEAIAAVAPLTLFGQKIFGTWTIGLGLALLFGAAFQYAAIQPMRHLPPGRAIGEAFKADVLSLTAWQIGMYGGMGAFRFGIAHHDVPASSPLFWLAMQVAMLLGFATSFPVNAWLLARGIKERM